MKEVSLGFLCGLMFIQTFMMTSITFSLCDIRDNLREVNKVIVNKETAHGCAEDVTPSGKAIVE